MTWTCGPVVASCSHMLEAWLVRATAESDSRRKPRTSASTGQASGWREEPLHTASVSALVLGGEGGDARGVPPVVFCLLIAVQVSPKVEGWGVASPRLYRWAMDLCSCNWSSWMMKPFAREGRGESWGIRPGSWCSHLTRPFQSHLWVLSCVLPKLAGAVQPLLPEIVRRPT